MKHLPRCVALRKTQNAVRETHFFPSTGTRLNGGVTLQSAFQGKSMRLKFKLRGTIPLHMNRICRRDGGQAAKEECWLSEALESIQGRC